MVHGQSQEKSIDEDNDIGIIPKILIGIILVICTCGLLYRVIMILSEVKDSIIPPDGKKKPLLMVSKVSYDEVISSRVKVVSSYCHLDTMTDNSAVLYLYDSATVNAQKITHSIGSNDSLRDAFISSIAILDYLANYVTGGSKNKYPHLYCLMKNGFYIANDVYQETDNIELRKDILTVDEYYRLKRRVFKSVDGDALTRESEYIQGTFRSLLSENKNNVNLISDLLAQIMMTYFKNIGNYSSVVISRKMRKMVDIAIQEGKLTENSIDRLKKIKSMFDFNESDLRKELKRSLKKNSTYSEEGRLDLMNYGCLKKNTPKEQDRYFRALKELIANLKRLSAN